MFLVLKRSSLESMHLIFVAAGIGFQCVAYINVVAHIHKLQFVSS